jgi:hypothetical protein
MNEPIFERCPHDKQNPYVMISREMAQDKTISPKAKGVLLYLFSLPSNWKIYHSQLQNGLGIGEEYLNSALDELIAAGYAERTRERVKGIFQPYRYKIREFKKCLPNGENRPGSSGPENPGIQNTDGANKEEQQQGSPSDSTDLETPAAAAVFSNESSSLKPNPQVVPCPDGNKSRKWLPDLDDIDIPDQDKVEISKRYKPEVVKNAIAWARHPETKISKGLSPAIKWACQNKPEVPTNSEDRFEDNKAYAKLYDGQQSEYATIDALSKHVEIIMKRGQISPICIKYEEKSFREQFENALKKVNISLRKLK